MTEISVAVIGYGFIGKVHTYGYRNLPFFYDPAPARIRLAAICDARPDALEKAKRDAGFESVTTDLSEVLSRKDIQAVDICTPNQFHADALIAAIRAGKHIYCEKPLTGTWSDAKRVAQALKGYAGTNQMTMNTRFSLAALRAKQLVEEGFVGRVTQFRAGYYHAGSLDASKPMGWKQEAAAGGGVINDLASHVVDVADWLAGPLAQVLAETRVLYPERTDQKGRKVAVEAEDSVTIMARLRDGGVGVIEASKIATGANDELRVEIHGDRGALRFNTMQPNCLEAYSLADPEEPCGGVRGWRRIDTVHRYPKPAGWPGPKFAVGWLRSHVHSLHSFVSAVAEGRQTRPSLADGVRLQYLLEVVRQSASERAWREVREETPC
jgi:predicted dehydrogenase